MKKIGLIGGVGPEATLDYYKAINRYTNDRLGDYHCANILMVSSDFQPVVDALFNDDTDYLNQVVYQSAKTLEAMGADVIAICSNTVHKAYAHTASLIKTPILHILDPVIAHCKAQNISKIALLGTRFTMAGDFHIDYLKSNVDVEVLVPNDAGREIVHHAIFDELVKGISRKETADRIVDVIKQLADQGAQAAILGCTELPLAFRHYLWKERTIPVLDTVQFHARALVDCAFTAERATVQSCSKALLDF